MPFGLKAVDPLHPLVRHRIGAKGDQVQNTPQRPQQQRRGQSRTRRPGRKADTQARQDRSEDLARNRRAAGDCAGLPGLVGLLAFTRQPGGQQQQAKGNQIGRQPDRPLPKGGQGQDKGQHEQQVHPRTCAGRAGAVQRGLLAAVRLRPGAGAVFATISLVHGPTPAKAA
jgi:hypothetical protein